MHVLTSSSSIPQGLSHWEHFFFFPGRGGFSSKDKINANFFHQNRSVPEKFNELFSLPRSSTRPRLTGESLYRACCSEQVQPSQGG